MEKHRLLIGFLTAPRGDPRKRCTIRRMSFDSPVSCLSSNETPGSDKIRIMPSPAWSITGLEDISQSRSIVRDCLRGIDLSVRVTTPLDPGSGKWFKHPSLGARTAIMGARTEKRDNPGSGNLRMQDCWESIQVWNKDARSNSEQFDVNSRCSLNSFVFLSPLLDRHCCSPLFHYTSIGISK